MQKNLILLLVTRLYCSKPIITGNCQSRPRIHDSWPQIMNTDILHMVIHAPRCNFNFMLWVHYDLPVIFCTNEAEHDCGLFTSNPCGHRVVDSTALKCIERHEEFSIYTVYPPAQRMVTKARYNYTGQLPLQFPMYGIVTKHEAYQQLHEKMQKLFKQGANITANERDMIIRYRKKQGFSFGCCQTLDEEKVPPHM
jgi:hypothetical protein